MPAAARFLQDAVPLDQLVEAAQKAFAVLAVFTGHLQHAETLQKGPTLDRRSCATVTKGRRGGNRGGARNWNRSLNDISPAGYP